MPTPISNELKLELAKIEQGALLDLYEIDMRGLTNAKGEVGDIYRFYAGTNELKRAVIWQGKTFEPYPIHASGFDKSGQGPSNRPMLSISNLFGIVTGIATQFDEAVGAVVRRRQVYMRYLDAVNFSGGNKQADPTQEIISQYIIEQLSSLKHDVATFTLALPIETDNALLPARVIMADTCTWIYRSVECGYIGGAVADEKDQPTTELKKDQCSRCTTGCAMRKNTHNFGGFVSVGKLG